ncbi:enoyl-CoA hydratase/isomerase family protein [Desulfatitalea tepidiphila]|uniref:enoyl-CoA hydratase/isomerase family protein n=1 Tax=Desulfatitalea tepidiphila TaxID=1185843 RepID=UPI0006B625BD|nr:enoyl-CoA hydratase/isomerase family protein [Desulfatitalea tepidiphila]
MYAYRMDDNVAVLTMNNGENRFNLASIQAFGEVLDDIVDHSGANALVVTSAHPKIWCNGIDLDWLLPEVQTGGETSMNRFLCNMYKLFKRLLTMPMPTVAAINGHAFAGGAFLAFSHDFRFMRADRGWISLPEVDLGMTLGPVFMAISKKVMPVPLLEEMQYCARRLTAQECAERQIITRVCTLETLIGEAVAFAKSLNKPRDIIQRMKLETLKPVLTVVDETIASLQK